MLYSPETPYKSFAFGRANNEESQESVERLEKNPKTETGEQYLQRCFIVLHDIIGEHVFQPNELKKELTIFINSLRGLYRGNLKNATDYPDIKSFIDQQTSSYLLGKVACSVQRKEDAIIGIIPKKRIVHVAVLLNKNFNNGMRYQEETNGQNPIFPDINQW